jgi:hypothetical protein
MNLISLYRHAILKKNVYIVPIGLVVKYTRGPSRTGSWNKGVLSLHTIRSLMTLTLNILYKLQTLKARK